jgi:hypothetical protein
MIPPPAIEVSVNSIALLSCAVSADAGKVERAVCGRKKIVFGVG